MAGRRQRRLREQRRNPSSNGGDWQVSTDFEAGGTKKDIEVFDPQRGIVLKSYREILEQQLAETLTHEGNAGDLIYQIAVLSLGIEARGGKAPKGMKRIKEQEPILREYFHGLDPRVLFKSYHFFVFDDAQDEWLPSGFVSPEHFTHQRSHDLTMLEEYFFVAKHLGEEKYLPLIRAHYKKIREAHGLPKNKTKKNPRRNRSRVSKEKFDYKVADFLRQKRVHDEQEAYFAKKHPKWVVESWWDDTPHHQLIDMAEGGGGGGEDYDENDKPLSTVRQHYYPDWTNSDFRLLLKRIGSPYYDKMLSRR